MADLSHLLLLFNYFILGTAGMGVASPEPPTSPTPGRIRKILLLGPLWILIPPLPTGRFPESPTNAPPTHVWILQLSLEEPS